MTRSLAASVLGVALALVGCEEERLPPPLPASAAPLSPSVASSMRPRTRSYFAANEDQTCVVYWQEGEQRSVSKSIPCPRELEPGERMRLAGRTCMREAVAEERSVPVRCAKQVLYVERDDQLAKGEYKLAPKK